MNAITLGVFLEPPAWIDNQTILVTINKHLAPRECNKIVQVTHLSHDIDLFVWRQGFIAARFTQGFIGPTLSTFEPLSGISKMEIGRLPLMFFNALLYIFYNEKLEGKHGSSWTPKQYIHARDIFVLTGAPSDNLEAIAHSIPMPFSPRFFADAPIYEMGRVQGILSPMNQTMMPTYPLLAIDNTTQKLEQLFAAGLEMLDCVSLLNGAVYYLQEGQLSQSVILSWAVAERCINSLWDEYWKKVPSGPINTTPKTKGNFVVRHIKRSEKNVGRRIELLESEGAISPQLYSQLVAARVSRNKWMHDLQAVAYKDTRDSHACANELLQAITGVSLTHPGASPL